VVAYQKVFFNQYLSTGIQFSRASLNGALTQQKNKYIKTLNKDIIFIWLGYCLVTLIWQ